MKVGSSLVYFLEEQREKLEEFSKYLKSKEKEAFELIQKKKILEDEKQDPAIRVALRQIRDFAIPFKKQDKIFWRYFKFLEQKDKEEDLTNKKEIQEIPKHLKEKVEIFDKQEEKQETKKPKPKILKKRTTKKKSTKSATEKKNEKFFDKVKGFLSKNNIELTGIEGFTKDSLTLLVKENSQEKLLIAYNKKRIVENDIIKANKKALEKELKYLVLSLGETSKKINDFVEAIKNLSDLKKIE